MASGAAVSPQQQELQATLLRLRSQGVSDAQLREAEEYTRELWRRVNAGARLEDFADLARRADAAPWGRAVPRMRMDFELSWWRTNEVDAAHALEVLRVPTLSLFGADDSDVPPQENAPLMTRRLAAAPATDYSVIVLPASNHRFMKGDNYQPLYFATMSEWVVRRFSLNH